MSILCSICKVFRLGRRATDAKDGPRLFVLGGRDGSELEVVTVNYEPNSEWHTARNRDVASSE
jgi:hypothetical protein